MPKPLTARKLDLIYLVFFIVHIPVMLFVDLVPLYPPSLRPAFTLTLREWYIATYRDRFFIAPSAWFYAFTVLEAVYHLPLSVWAVCALVADHPLIPLHLLVFAIETGVTTLTCAVDVYAWEGYTSAEKEALAGLYLPYLGLAVLMGVDMFFRLKRVVAEHARIGGLRKRV